MKTMTENLKRLNMLICEGCVNPDDFYSLDVSRYSIRLYGHVSKKKRFKYKSMFSLKKSSHTIGQFEGERGDIRMVLTRKN